MVLRRQIKTASLILLLVVLFIGSLLAAVWVLSIPQIILISVEQPLIPYLVRGLVTFGPVMVFVLLRKRWGELVTASWLVILGAFAILGEHVTWTLAYTVPNPLTATELLLHPMNLLSHARYHFFMAGIYAAIGVILLCVIARTLLKQGNKLGWYLLLFVLLVGGITDLTAATLWSTEHGIPPTARGMLLWEYYVAWMAALLISYKPIFTKTR
ncbi:MAG: hypothetical protein LYZ66_05335 [Nitrososphaerales archaeon]|nr:hypothetical protein [Nitrososphaerales archaeon]